MGSRVGTSSQGPIEGLRVEHSAPAGRSSGAIPGWPRGRSDSLTPSLQIQTQAMLFFEAKADADAHQRGQAVEAAGDCARRLRALCRYRYGGMQTRVLCRETALKGGHVTAERDPTSEKGIIIEKCPNGMIIMAIMCRVEGPKFVMLATRPALVW